MQMKVENRLSGIRSGVDYHAKSALLKSLLNSYVFCYEDQTSDQTRLLLSYGAGGVYVAVRYDQYMNRRNRI
jgi:hypothetical protein